MPAFDPSVNYMKLMLGENEKMQILKEQLESESGEYFSTLKQVLMAQVSLKQEIRNNEECLRKRDQKLEQLVKEKVSKCSRRVCSGESSSEKPAGQSPLQS